MLLFCLDIYADNNQYHDQKQYIVEKFQNQLQNQELNQSQNQELNQSQNQSQNQEQIQSQNKSQNHEPIQLQNQLQNQTQKPTYSKYSNPQELSSIHPDTRYDYVSDQIDKLRREYDEMRTELNSMSKIVKTINELDTQGDYIVNGWFVQFHNVIDTPAGVFLGEIINKIYGVPVICFRSKEGYPFVGPPDKPMFFPKSNSVGMRAMTVLKIPKTGYYDFKILTDDGMRVYYQKVASSIILNEKNSRTIWTNLIDSWLDQSDIWITSKKLYFNENELILIRIDYYELTGYASACIRLRYYLDDSNDKIEEINIPYKNMFCSLLWAEVPLLGAF
jgi:hypothetical protein